jgi:hypothetical protein
VSILSSTLTPTIHPTFPLRFVSYDSIFTNPAASSPDPDMVVDMISTAVGSKQPGMQFSVVDVGPVLINRRGTALPPHSVFTALFSPAYTSRDVQPPGRNLICRIDIHIGSVGHIGKTICADYGRNGLEYALAGRSDSDEAIRGRTRCQPHGR